MGRDAAHEDDEDEKRKRHRFKRVPTRNGDAGALIYPDLASRFQNINVLGFSQQMFVTGEYEERGIFELCFYVMFFVIRIKASRKTQRLCIKYALIKITDMTPKGV